MLAVSSRSSDLGADTDPRLFDHIFQNEIYTAWETGNKTWQLHCHGSPGCGKTVFAEAAADHIREASNGSSTAVTIFILDNAELTSTAFIEDIVHHVYEQLADEGSKSGSKETPPDKQYAEMKSYIHEYISARPTYLVLDGYDRLNDVVQKQLDRELRSLQKHRLRVMLTRRVPAWSPLSNNTCDFCYKRDIVVYWICQECEANGEDFFLCYMCHLDPTRGCNKHVDAHFVEESYHHVDLEININSGQLKGYLLDHLEKEWPDLNIGTCKNITKFVIDYSSANITIARLYLEEYLNQDDVPTFDSSRLEERLPSGIIAYLESDLNSIESVAGDQRTFTLKTLHKVASAGPNGMPLAALANEVWPEKEEEEEGLEAVLKLANGWLVQWNTEIREIQFCCGDIFRRYVLENYSESVFQVKELLEEQLGPKAKTDQPENLHASTEGNFNMVSDIIGNKGIRGSTLGKEGLGICLTHRDTLRESLRESSGSSYDMMSDVSTSGTTSERTRHKASKSVHINPSSRSKMINGNDKIVQSPPRMTSDEMVVTISHPSVGYVVQKSSTPRICAFCKANVLNTSIVQGTHRTTLDEDESVLEHCVFCCALYSDILNTKRPSFYRIQWPLYRWTLHKTTSARQSEGSIVLTFRPLNPEMQPKRFHLIPEASMFHSSGLVLGPTTEPKYHNGPGAQIQRWIEACDSQHNGCSKWKSGNFLPTRLLDLQDAEEGIIRLVNTTHMDVEGPYCTLSHMWGPNDFITTTPENIEEILFKGIRLTPCPGPSVFSNKTFLDAIKVAKFLGIRYIWIDSLCIIQGPRGDFDVEGGLMHQVYRNTYCNIVAAGLDGGERGLFCEAREPEKLLPVRYSSNKTNPLLGTNQWTIMPTRMWDSDLLASVIYTRGWVFQERMLSPRLLHFTQNQIFWDCCTTSACETLPTGLPLPLDRLAATDRHWRGRLSFIKDGTSKTLSGPIDNESSDGFWLSAVQYYTSCNLTNQGDKSVAIWSVAKILRDIFQESYAVGMWSNNLEEQLAWRVKDVKKSERPWDLSSLPSWSWISVKGSILPQHRITRRMYRVKDPKGDAITFNSKDPNGNRNQEPKLVGKALAMSGYVHDGSIEAREKSQDKYAIKIKLDEHKYVLLDAFPDEDPWKNKQLYSNCKFLLLSAGRTTHARQSVPSVDTNERYVGLGLILSPKSHVSTSQVGNYYRRIGAVHFQEVGRQIFQSLRGGVLCNFWLE